MTEAAVSQPTPQPQLTERQTSINDDLAAADERANALIAQFREEKQSADVAEGEAESAAATKVDPNEAEKRARRAAVKKGAATPAEGDEAEVTKLEPTTKEAPPEARDERLDRLAAIEREAVRQKAHLDVLKRTLTEREAAIAAREKRIEEQEKAFEDPEELLGLMDRKVGVDRLNKWILEQADPAKRAELAARRATQKVDERIAKAEEENRRLREEIAAKERAKEEAQVRSDAHRSFAARVTAVKDEAPLVARMIDRRPDRALRRCDEIAETLSARNVPFNFDDVIVHYERELSDEAAVYRDDPQQNGSAAATSQSQQTSPSSAAAKATPVTNRAAATRTSIMEDDEADLPLEERARRTERRLRSIR